MAEGIFINLAISAALYAGTRFAQEALAPRPVAELQSDPPLSAGAQPAEINNARNYNVRRAVPPRQYAYGECRLGGVVFFEDNANPYLYVGCALSDGESSAILALYFGNQQVPLAAESPAGQAAAATGTIWTGNVNLSYRLGTASQTADPLLSAFAGLPANFWQRGVTCAVVRMNWGASSTEHAALWGDGVSPSFLGRWRKVYDPRDGTQTLGNRSTYKYSDNPALCAADFLTSAWGIALPVANLDWASVGVAADRCDDDTTYLGTPVNYFSLAGVVRSETDMASQLQAMLDSFRGRITYSGGFYKIVADAARASVWTIADDDILEISEHVHGASRADAYNAIKAVYTDNSSGDRENTAPVYEISAAVAAEGLRETSVRLPFTPSTHSAQILAYRKLQELRNGRRLIIRVHDAGMFLDAFEVVTVNTSYAMFINGIWSIDQIDVADVGVILTMREYVSALYADPTTYFQ